MTADEIVRRLNGKWSEKQALARCPVEGHGKGRGDLSPSLSIAVGNNGRVLLHCFAGCRAEDIFAALNSGHRVVSVPQVPRYDLTPFKHSTAGAAQALWNTARPVNGTGGESYLRSRGLDAESNALRFLTQARHPKANGPGLTALLAAVHGPDNLLSAVQRTFLTPAGSKACIDPVRMMLGRLGRGAVRLAPARKTLGLAEGVETALSAAQMFGVPVWAVCGTRLARVDLPSSVREVIVFTDHDAAGALAAEAARRRFTSEGLSVEIMRPQCKGWDWNDALLASRGARDACR